LSLDEKPSHTKWGDGSELTDDELNIIESIEKKIEFKIDWNIGDLIILDNTRYTHKREP